MKQRARRTGSHTSAVVWSCLAMLCGLASGHAADPRVYRDRVEPHWLEGGDRFWYRNDLRGGGREFVEVDAAAGIRRPAFDHSVVASNLARITGQPVAGDRLPIEAIEPLRDPPGWLLQGRTNGWRLDLATGELTPASDARAEGTLLEPEEEPHPSRRTGPETEILFQNRLGVELQLFWISDAGQRQPYGLIPAGGERAQHTFAGHVWLVKAGSTNVGVFTATARPAVAVVGEGQPMRPRRGRREAPTTREPAVVRSPDGALEALVRDENLWIRETGTGSERALSVDGSVGNSYRRDVTRDRLIGMEYEKPDAPATLPEVYWSPDGRWLVAMQTRSVPERRVHLVESSPRDQLQPRLLSYPYLKAGDEIPVQSPHLFEVAGRREAPMANALFPNPWSLSDVRWATNSGRFTMVYNQRGHQVLRVLAVEVPTGAVRVAIDELSPTFVDYSGKYLCEWVSDDEVLWMSERSGWNHLHLFDVAAGLEKLQVTRGEWAVHDLVHLDRERREVWFRAVGIRAGQDPYYLHLVRAKLDGSQVEVMTEGDGTHAVTWSPDRRYFVDTWSRVDQPPAIELRRAADGGRACLLETADASEVLEARGPFPERFVAKGRDGMTDIYGVIHRPKGFDPARKYAVLENIYAGPHDFHVPKVFRARYGHAEDLADRGFIVVQVDGMGTSWRSKAFHDVAWRNLKDAGFPDRIAWMRAGAARYPEMDLARVGIYGGSAGGQNAAGALLWHGDFYKAAVADCGCHDNRMDKIWWNEQWMGWPVGPHYAENSNTENAARLQGDLLLIVGELDRNVDPSSTYQLSAALQKAGKDHELLVVQGAGHGAGETPYGSRKRAEFFVRHLLGGAK